MLKHALSLWKQERHKGTTLQRRLILFFACITALVIFAFALLLLLFNITGSGKKAVYYYMDNELSHIGAALSSDFGKLSVQGVSFSENVAAACDEFFKQENITPNNLAKHPDLLEKLLSGQMHTAISLMDGNTCGGVFVLLDATVNPDAENAEYAKAGFFLKKTQPQSVAPIGTKNHYLRGPAQIARDNGIELLGQWRMEFDISDQAFFTEVMNTARENPDLPLSRLYYWTERVTLKGNSETGFLLCVPLRAKDGTVFGVCGIEVSDRMFKQNYSPNTSAYENVFSAAAPVKESVLYTEHGLIAGSTYLTGKPITENLSLSSHKDGFTYFSGDSAYGGLLTPLKLYPSDSPYSTEEWAAAVMMPDHLLAEAIKGSSSYLLVIVLLLLLISLTASVFISRRYLRPVTEALDTIKNKSFHNGKNSPYLEINDLMEYLAKQDEEIKRGQISISEPESDGGTMFEEFVKNVQMLSPAERKVFELYIKGYKAQEIADTLCVSINTIKTHNRRIFAKLNVSSRKELLVYIDRMKEMNLISEV